jgi:hypothetical protein
VQNYIVTKKADKIMTDLSIKEQKTDIDLRLKPEKLEMHEILLNEMNKKDMSNNLSEQNNSESLFLLKALPSARKNQEPEKTSYTLLPLNSKEVIHTEAIYNQTQRKSVRIEGDHTDLKLSSTNPTIKVNIGRIEVKAIMQQTSSPQRTVQQKPKLSLEKYLEKRSGGHR